MNKIIRNIKLFFLYSKSSIKSTFQARLGVVFFTLGKVLRFLMFFLFIFFLTSKTSTLKGYTTDQAIFFYLTFNVVDTTAQLLFREVYRFRDLILRGSFDTILVKPHHPFLKILIGGVDFLDLLLLIPYLALTLFFGLKTGHGSLFNLALYLALVLNALLIATAFHIAVLALGILTTEVDHTIMIYRDITALGRFPIEIYKEPLRGIFTFIIPVGIMMSFPAKALFGLLKPNFIIFSFALSFLLFFASLKLWGVAVKRYQSWGG